MSTNDPDEIRYDIERTRAELGRDVDALAEKVSPAKAASRQTDRIREGVASLRESVMGSDDDPYGIGRGGLHGATDRASHVADEAGQTVRQAPATVRRRTRGNPLAAGLIALGAGWLVGSLMPASRAEQDAAVAVKEQAAPLVDEAKAVAQEMGEHLKPQAQEAALSVKDTAQSGVEHVKDEGQARAAELKDESQRAAQRVKDSSDTTPGSTPGTTPGY